MDGAALRHGCIDKLNMLVRRPKISEGYLLNPVVEFVVIITQRIPTFIKVALS